MEAVGLRFVADGKAALRISGKIWDRHTGKDWTWIVLIMIKVIHLKTAGGHHAKSIAEIGDAADMLILYIQRRQPAGQWTRLDVMGCEHAEIGSEDVFPTAVTDVIHALPERFR